MNVDICSNAYCNHSSFYCHFKGENIKVALRDLLIFMGGGTLEENYGTLE